MSYTVRTSIPEAQFDAAKILHIEAIRDCANPTVIEEKESTILRIEVKPNFTEADARSLVARELGNEWQMVCCWEPETEDVF